VALKFSAGRFRTRSIQHSDKKLFRLPARALPCEQSGDAGFGGFEASLRRAFR
jgi:hypothetical protein